MELSRPVVMQHHGHLTLTLDFQRQILKMLYLRNGRADWHGTKGMWVDRILHPLCDVQRSHHPWRTDVRFWCISSTQLHMYGMLIAFPSTLTPPLSNKELTWHPWTHVVTFNVHLTHDLGFSRSDFENAVSQEWGADWHGTKGMWVDRMLHPLCDFQL